MTPNLSRIMSESPWPVTTPMRLTISWIMISRTVVGMTTHRIARPK